MIRRLFSTVFLLVGLHFAIVQWAGATEPQQAEPSVQKKKPINPNDPGGPPRWDSFVKRIGKDVYFAAFPTATYRGTRLRNVTKGVDGTEVVFEIYGTSASDNSELETDVIVTVKDSKIRDLRWGKTNAVLLQPGATESASNNLLDHLNKEFQPPPDAAPADRFLDHVRAQLLSGMAIIDRGYELTSTPYTGSLRQGQVDEFNVNLNAGQKYVFIGVCDEGCSNIDIYLYDENRHLIDSDTKTDDRPLVVFTPKWSGRFNIKVKMERCSNQSCFYGVGNFQK